MSRIGIKSKTKIKKVKVPYDAELNDMREWQENMYNPGHYVGTGKVPYPLKQLARRPKIKLAYLLYILLPIFIVLFFMDLVWYNVIPVMVILFLIAFIIYDSKRILKKKYNKK
ncbi:MAG: hypothetical protein K0S75_1250 [Clostridia bacterium]|jgi:hypothetical protein|nr:hypothetical protein [Clostridia bacterium]